MAETPSPVAICSVCLKPLAELPAVLRQGEGYVHVTCWTGEEPAERATAEGDETAEDKKGRGQAA